MLDTVREFAAERAGDLAPPPSSGTRATSSATASASPRRPRAPTGATRWSGSRSSARTSASPTSGCCAPARPTRRCGSRSRFAEALPWDAHTQEVRGWLAAACRTTGDAPALRATALYWDGRLAITQARFAEAEPRLRAALDAAREAGEPRAGGAAC